METSNNRKKKQLKQQNKQRKMQNKLKNKNKEQKLQQQLNNQEEQSEQESEKENEIDLHKQLIQNIESVEDGLQISAPEQDKRKLIIILQKAPLEVGKLNKKMELINGDDHRQFIQHKLKEDFAKYRPDILHQSLLAIFDSPLNKMGMVQVYIQTEKNLLIEINPTTKIPRTYKRFAALFAQLITKLKIRAVEKSLTLLKVIKNPVTNYFPFDCKKIGTSCKARLVNLKEYVAKLPKKEPIVFVVGAVAAGNAGVEVDFLDDSICISKYPLSAACCLFKILNEFEILWENQ